MRTVHIVDNGGVPFRVVLRPVRPDGSVRPVRPERPERPERPDSAHAGRATVSALVHGSDPDAYVVLGTIRYARAYVGLCPTELDGGPKLWWHGGNSVLLRTHRGTFVYVGATIKAFRPIDDTIVAFVSPMGNAHCPSPYAIGRTHTYLMEEGTRIDNATLIRVAALEVSEVVYAYDLTGGRSVGSTDRSMTDRSMTDRSTDRSADRSGLAGLSGQRKDRVACAFPMRVLLSRKARPRTTTSTSSSSGAPAGLFAFYTLRSPHGGWEWRALPRGWIHTGRGRTRDAKYQLEESFSGPAETTKEAKRALVATLEEQRARGRIVRYRVSRTYDIGRESSERSERSATSESTESSGSSATSESSSARSAHGFGAPRS